MQGDVARLVAYPVKMAVAIDQNEDGECQGNSDREAEPEMLRAPDDRAEPLCRIGSLRIDEGIEEVLFEQQGEREERPSHEQRRPGAVSDGRRLGRVAGAHAAQ